MPDDEADAATLKALRRIGRIRIFAALPSIAAGLVVWWYGYHWLQQRYALDDGMAQMGTLVVVALAAMAIVMLTGFGVPKTPPLSPRLQALARERHERTLARARLWRIAGLSMLLLAELPLALTGGDWDRKGLWTTAVLILSFAASEPVFTASVGESADLRALTERLQAIRAGFLTIVGLSACLIVRDAYSSGASARFLPVVLLLGVLVAQIRLVLGRSLRNETAVPHP